LGRPSRFLNMLRVFKPQSPMSVGSWTLMVFSGSAAAAAWLGRSRPGGANALAAASQVVSTLTGLTLSTYTGVLLGATAVPVWSENSALLPVHFAASATGSAAGLLELAGHSSSRPLNVLSIASAMAETAVGGRIEIRSDRALQPLKSGSSGWITRVGGILSGPLPLVLRLLAGNSETERARTARRIAAVSTITGSVLTRIAWLKAGRASAGDAKLPLAARR
jgi:formate-dependent nitrite reductase membrane component NrfD